VPIRDSDQGTTLLDDTLPLPNARGSSPAPVAGPLATPEDRYAIQARLGAGGMGEVELALDRNMRREVALKILLPELSRAPDAVERFAWEARIQGRLEHPSIVPVHDLGVRTDGRIFFTMKRVRGQTLADVLEALGRGDPDARRQFTRRRLLNAFVSVCMALEFAHRAGVLHRDLKPSNIMLGDFGEVYVLDWGIARLLTERDTAAAPATATSMEDLPRGTATADGAWVGTPGYMAPEQVQGESALLDARTDVYALGAVLFEILTGARLHDRGSAALDMASTLDGADASIVDRFPDLEVAPELESICVRATALAKTDRFESVGKLAEALERYLDGERDMAQRLSMAEKHAGRASDLAAQALRDPDLALRRRALAEVGRALGLDPSNVPAREVAIALLTSPPSAVPGEVQATLDRSTLELQRLSSRLGMLAFGGWGLVSLPLAAWMGVRSASLFAIFVGLQWLACLAAWRASRARRILAPVNVLSAAAALLANTALDLAFGPLVLLPTAVAGTATLLLLFPRLGRRWPVVLSAAATVTVPFAIEAIGVVRSPYRFENGTMTVASPMLSLPATPTLLVLFIASMATFGVIVLSVTRVRSSLDEAEKQLALFSWQLRQMID